MSAVRLYCDQTKALRPDNHKEPRSRHNGRLKKYLGRGFNRGVRVMRTDKPTESAEIRKTTELSAVANVNELTPAIDASRPAEISDGQMSADNLGILVRRVSASSTQQIENLVGELQTLRKKLHTDGNRIQGEIEEYAVLNQQVMQLTAIIFESMSKLAENGGGDSERYSATLG